MTENETIDLLITFFEQERDYASEVLERDKYSSPMNSIRLLKKRILWFNTLICTLKEFKGIKDRRRYQGAQRSN